MDSEGWGPRYDDEQQAVAGRGTGHCNGSRGPAPGWNGTVNDQLYPAIHPRWGGFAEELLHHTSRYYAYAEAFLRNLSGRRDFQLAGYRAEGLGHPQRRLLAAMLTLPPSRQLGRDVTAFVDQARAGVEAIAPALEERYRALVETLPAEASHPYYLSFHEHTPPPDLPPLDPFLAQARRLQMPVAVHGHHVEVPLKVLARHLDSPLEQVRVNLQEAILWLHEAGYRLRNNPDLSRAEAEGGG